MLRFRRAVTIGPLMLVLASQLSCLSYQYMKNVKLLSYEENVTTGKSVGPVRGEDCSFMFLGYWFGGEITLDEALANLRTQTSSWDQTTGNKKTLTTDGAIRYINNVSTTTDGWNAGVAGKNCLVVKGTGYR
jgi:hypothetical protein